MFFSNLPALALGEKCPRFTKLGPGRAVAANFQERVVIRFLLFCVAGEQSAGCLAFNKDITSPSFGMWNGNVTNPRDIQLAARLTF